MGTSTSNPGPSDRQPLLPSWAPPPDKGNDIESNDGDDKSPSKENQPDNLLPAPQVTWQKAKTSMSRFASSSQRNCLSSAGRDYVGAKGGKTAAARAAVTGKLVALKVGGFLSTATSAGIGAALDKFGLAHMVGKHVSEVLAALIDVLAPAGATLQEAAARKAANEVLEKLYEDYIVKSEDITALESLDKQGIVRAIEASVAGYIYILWLDELGKRIETKAISSLQAVSLERDVKVYVKECVKFEMIGQDPVSIDWNGTAGRDIIDTVFQEAYGFLEVGQ